MITKNQGQFILLLFAILIACSQNNDKALLKSGQITLSQEVSHILSNIKSDHYLLYYGDGDCSFCIGKMRNLQEISKKLKNTKTVFIVHSADTTTFYYHVRKIGIDDNDLIFIDNESSFVNNNLEYLQLSDVMLLSTDFRLLSIGDPITNKRILNEFFRITSIGE